MQPVLPTHDRGEVAVRKSHRKPTAVELVALVVALVIVFGVAIYFGNLVWAIAGRDSGLLQESDSSSPQDLTSDRGVGAGAMLAKWRGFSSREGPHPVQHPSPVQADRLERGVQKFTTRRDRHHQGCRPDGCAGSVRIPGLASARVRLVRMVVLLTSARGNRGRRPAPSPRGRTAVRYLRTESLPEQHHHSHQADQGQKDRSRRSPPRFRRV